jgi:hypothetical protein
VRTFIVRLQEDPAGGGRTDSRPDGQTDAGTDTATLRLRGVVDEVATGMRATFRNDQELVTALIAAVGADPPGPSWGGWSPAPREPLSH